MSSGNASESDRMRAVFGDPADYPRDLGPYQLLAPLAGGGMGVVHVARTGAVAGIQKYCVVKTLLPSLTRDKTYVRRFVDEARIVVHLTHRNIAQVFDVGRVRDQYYVAMELVPGRDIRTLQNRLADLGRHLPEAIALRIICELLDALDYAHRFESPITGQPLELVHRDVSAQNVMLNVEGEVKLIDFGVASSTQSVDHTDSELVYGKITYMAPEAVRGLAEDRRADVFSAAVLGYELLTGERFYEGLNQNEIWRAALDGTHQPARLGDLDDGLQSILRRALHHDRDKRTDSAEALREELEGHLLRQQTMVSTRHLRELMKDIYPDERQRFREMLLGLAEITTQSPAPEPEGTMTIATGAMGLMTAHPFVEVEAPAPEQPLPRSQMETLDLGGTLADLDELETAHHRAAAAGLLTDENEHEGVAASSEAPTIRPGFYLPDFDRDVDVQLAIDRVPEGAFIKGLFLVDVQDALVRAGHKEAVERQGRFSSLRDYPLVSYLAAVAEAARLLHPDLALAEGLRQVGRRAYPAFAESPVGRIVFGLFGRDLQKVMNAASKAYRMAGWPGTCNILESDQDHVLVELVDMYSFVDTLQVGVFEGACLATGQAGLVSIERVSHAHCRYDVRWGGLH